MVWYGLVWYGSLLNWCELIELHCMILGHLVFHPHGLVRPIPRDSTSILRNSGHFRISESLFSDTGEAHKLVQLSFFCLLFSLCACMTTQWQALHPLLLHWLLPGKLSAGHLLLQYNPTMSNGFKMPASQNWHHFWRRPMNVHILKTPKALFELVILCSRKINDRFSMLLQTKHSIYIYIQCRATGSNKCRANSHPMCNSIRCPQSFFLQILCFEMSASSGMVQASRNPKQEREYQLSIYIYIYIYVWIRTWFKQTPSK